VARSPSVQDYFSSTSEGPSEWTGPLSSGPYGSQWVRGSLGLLVPYTSDLQNLLETLSDAERLATSTLEASKAALNLAKSLSSYSTDPASYVLTSLKTEICLVAQQLNNLGVYVLPYAVYRESALENNRGGTLGWLNAWYYSLDDIYDKNRPTIIGDTYCWQVICLVGAPSLSDQNFLMALSAFKDVFNVDEFSDLSTFLAQKKSPENIVAHNINTSGQSCPPDWHSGKLSDALPGLQSIIDALFLVASAIPVGDDNVSVITNAITILENRANTLLYAAQTIRDSLTTKLQALYDTDAWFLVTLAKGRENFTRSVLGSIEKPQFGPNDYVAGIAICALAPNLEVIAPYAQFFQSFEGSATRAEEEQELLGSFPQIYRRNRLINE